MDIIKNFSSKSVDDLENQLDDFVAELKQGQLLCVSPIIMSESGICGLSCEYRKEDHE